MSLPIKALAREAQPFVGSQKTKGGPVLVFLCKGEAQCSMERPRLRPARNIFNGFPIVGFELDSSSAFHNPM